MKLLFMIIFCVFPVSVSAFQSKRERIDSFIIRYKTEYRDSLQRGLDRSALYIGMIQSHVPPSFPEGIEYLPIVESNFHWRAKSHAGAVGLWQFIESTAEENGLRVSAYIDERMNPVKSTKAAMRYFNDLHRIFRDWELVLAAYNYGIGNLKKVLDKEKVKSFWDLKGIPLELKSYVPAFYAIVEIINDGRSNGFRVPDYTPVNLVKRKVAGHVSLVDIAKFLKEKPKNVLFWNGELKLGITPPGGWIINVPASFKADFLIHANF